MFTGIVKAVGEVSVAQAIDGAARLRVHSPEIMPGVAHGDSIAVQGVCLTVAEHDAQSFTADVMAETLRNTTLGALQGGDRVNLERALPVTGRFDGHVVQGHVDGTATVTAITPGPRWTDITFEIDAAHGRYLARKGSVTIDGVSLTITDVADTDGGTEFGVSLIPVTLAETTLGSLRTGDQVNIEIDVLAKYVERLLGARGHVAASQEGPEQ